jgi:hypothetical protein
MTMAMLELALQTEHTDSPLVTTGPDATNKYAPMDSLYDCTDNGATNKKQAAALLVNSGTHLNAC